MVHGCHHVQTSPVEIGHLAQMHELANLLMLDDWRAEKLFGQPRVKPAAEIGSVSRSRCAGHKFFHVLNAWMARYSRDQSVQCSASMPPPCGSRPLRVGAAGGARLTARELIRMRSGVTPRRLFVV